MIMRVRTALLHWPVGCDRPQQARRLLALPVMTASLMVAPCIRPVERLQHLPLPLHHRTGPPPAAAAPGTDTSRYSKSPPETRVEVAFAAGHTCPPHELQLCRFLDCGVLLQRCGRWHA